MDKTVDNNKKTTCPKCGHIVENGFCRNCFLKDMEEVDELLRNVEKARKNKTRITSTQRGETIIILMVSIIASVITSLLTITLLM